MAGRAVRLVVVARRFRCAAVPCRRRIFTERFNGSVLAPWARRTARPSRSSSWAGPRRPSGGEFCPETNAPREQRHAAACRTPTRHSIFHPTQSFTPPSVVGIDDWAWRRNQRYGTIICDLERRKTISLLPNREPATAQAWFSGQPQINIVARTVAASTRLRRLWPYQTPSKLPTVGECQPCLFPRGPEIHAGKSLPRSASRPSILDCSLPPSVSNMKATYAVRRPTAPFSLGAGRDLH